MKPATLLLLLIPTFSLCQTVTIPPITITHNPATNRSSVPGMTLAITPAPTAAPITIATLIGLALNIQSVDYNSGIHEIVGYDPAGILTIVNVQMTPGQVLAVSKITKPKISIITVPFKVRPSIDTFASKAQAGLTNIGLSLNFFNYKMDRYFSTGTQSTHTLSAGVFFAPNVEDIAPETTNNFVKATSSQLFISTGVALTYSYGDVSFVAVPIGFDLGTTSPGNKYVYNQKFWWGFGIGISTKIFGLQ